MLASTMLVLAGPVPAEFREPDAHLVKLQTLVDAAGDGETVMPPAGRYAGPVTISRKITLDGANGVVVDGRNIGTVIHIRADGATVKGLTVVNSGDQHNDIDAGIRIEGRFNVVKDNVIEESLFGIDLQESSSNIVRRNRISSKADAKLGVKGDAVRMWYSHDNRIEENTIDGSRDFVVWYSERNVVARNRITRGRYGLHFMYANNNLIEDNRLESNAVGIYLMYDEGDVIRRNRIVQALGAAGVGIGLKEASNVDIEDNEVLYNAVGMAFDITPFQPDSTVRIRRNRIAFNDIGISFLSNRPGNLFHANQFVSNTQHVAMRLFESAARAEWNGNYWDDYEGFDLDSDGIGDRPHILRSYADRLWMDVPAAAFFKGSPVLTVLDFIERLAPFTEPLLLLEDKRPRMRRDFALAGDRAAWPRPSKPTPTETEDDTEVAPAVIERTTPEGRIDPFGLYKK
ncbi:MAG: nitrous oxide reductase family maturation protein NosD [Pseudomonadota bacterium]